MSNLAVAKQQSSVPALAMNETELVDVLQSSVYPGAKIESIKLVIGTCRASGKDPLKKPYHIVPMQVSTGKKNDKGWVIKEWRDVIMPGINDYRTDASRTGQHAGTSEPEFGPDKNEVLNGVSITYPEWCRVTVKRLMPSGQIVEFSAVERWKENYATAGHDNDAPNAMWKRRPYAQLAKCAEAQALRKGFPEVGNQPTADEMEGKEIDMGSADVVIETKPTAPKVLPPYPPEQMEVDLPAMAGAIKSGKRTAEFLLSALSSKYTLTDTQKEAIKQLEKPEHIDADGVIDGEFIAAMNSAEKEPF